MKRKELVRMLEAAGYRFDRNNKHAIYEKPNSRPVQVPNQTEINKITTEQILKDAGLK